MPLLEDGSKQICYQLSTKPDINFIKIYLDDLNGVHVTAAENKDSSKIEAFLRKKTEWIHQKWQKTHEDLYSIDGLQLEDRQKISYLGRNYQLVIDKSKENEPSFQFQKGKFKFTYPADMNEKESLSNLHELLSLWMAAKAKEKFNSLDEQSIEVENDQTRLGVKDNNQIALNWRLVQRSKEEILLHIKDLQEERVC